MGGQVGGHGNGCVKMGRKQVSAGRGARAPGEGENGARQVRLFASSFASLISFRASAPCALLLQAPALPTPHLCSLRRQGPLPRVAPVSRTVKGSANRSFLFRISFALPVALLSRPPRPPCRTCPSTSSTRAPSGSPARRHRWATSRPRR